MNILHSPLKKGYRFQIYPTAEQRDLLERTFGCCRYVYNRALAEAKDEYQKYLALREASPLAALQKPDVSGYGFSARLPQYKADPKSSWLTEVSSVALVQSMLHLGEAFQRFFKEKKGYPQFKKKQNKQSFTLMAANSFTLRDGVFTMAKCKTPIKVGFSRELPSAPSQCTISRTPSGKYYVSFLCEYSPEKTSGTGQIGIDLGIKDFATLSTGEKIPNPKHYVSAQRRLKRLQQILARRKKGSANRKKARLAVAKQHERIANLRNTFHHQLSRRLVNQNQVIGLEGLKVANMLGNRKLSKHIADAAWSAFAQKLAHKVAESQHATLVQMDPFYPSSHLCSVTGQRLDRKLDLKERDWHCPHCGQVHDRDVNAACNILNKSLETLAKYDTATVAGSVVLAKR